MTAYREPPRTAPQELLFAPRARRSSDSSMVAMFELFGPPLVTLLALSLVFHAAAGAFGFFVVLFGSVWLRRRKEAGIVFRVEGERLVVTQRGRRLHAASLDALLDVALDTRTIRPVREGTSLVPEVRYIQTTVGPEVDRSRIVLVTTTQRIPLVDDDLAHMEAVEWVGRLRTFLRRAGWVPLDERPVGPDT